MHSPCILIYLKDRYSLNFLLKLPITVVLSSEGMLVFINNTFIIISHVWNQWCVFLGRFWHLLWILFVWVRQVAAHLHDFATLRKVWEASFCFELEYSRKSGNALFNDLVNRFPALTTWLIRWYIACIILDFLINMWEKFHFFGCSDYSVFFNPSDTFSI